MRFAFPSHQERKAPKARPIPAWGEAPGKGAGKVRGLKARPITISIPQIPLVILDTVLLQKRTQLILKRHLPVMPLLTVDIRTQRTQIRRPNGECSVPALPRESPQCRRFRFEPLRRGRLQLLHERCNIQIARHPNGQMHVVGDTADPIAFAFHVSSNRCKIGVEFKKDRCIEDRPAVLRAEDHVHQNKCQRLGHRRDYRSGLQPSRCLNRYRSWGFAPCWYSVAPSALMTEANYA